MSARELKIVKKFLNKHLQKKFIQISTSSATVLILLVKKSEKNIKMCINYKKLNILILRKEIIKKLLSEYHEFVDVFLSKKADQLSSHYFFDHKIELKLRENLFYYKN